MVHTEEMNTNEKECFLLLPSGGLHHQFSASRENLRETSNPPACARRPDIRGVLQGWWRGWAKSGSPEIGAESQQGQRMERTLEMLKAHPPEVPSLVRISESEVRYSGVLRIDRR